MKPVFLFGNLKWLSYKTIVLPLFQLPTRLNLQNTYETVFHNEIWHINLCMNFGISNWHNWIYYQTRLNFLTLYQLFTRLLTSKHWNPLKYKTWGEMDRYEKSAYQFLKLKKKICWNIKTKCVADFILTVRSSSMEDYTSHYGLST